ncbi:MAG TPA: hypothetical protein VG711_12540, partial [Phycisphaerales bacterium]|nr:hypothetical protein [Phycisphaerales bacterium]
MAVMERAKRLALDAGTLEVVRAWPRGERLVMLYSGGVEGKWSRWSVLAKPRGWYWFDGKSRWRAEGEVGWRL